MSNGISSQAFAPTFVSSQGLASVKASVERGSDRDHIGSMVSRAFDRIADWFCGTNHSEVKQCLFDIYSPDSSENQKYQAFDRLRTLAGDGHADKFVLREKGGADQESYEWGIEFFPGELELHSISKEELCFNNIELDLDMGALASVFEGFASGNVDEEQFKKDVERTGVIVEEGGAPIRSVSEFKARLTELNYSPDEVELAQKIFTQGSEADLLKKGVKDFAVGTVLGSSDSSFQTYKLGKTEAGISMEIHGGYNQAKNNHLKSLQEVAEFFGQNGESMLEMSDEKQVKTFLKGEYKLQLIFPSGQTKPEVTGSFKVGEWIAPAEGKVSFFSPEPQAAAKVEVLETGRIDPGLLLNMKA